MALRFWYEIEPVARGFQFEPVLAAVEVDPASIGIRELRDGLQPWAEQRLRRCQCDFGLYTADFSAWTDDDPWDAMQEYYVRALYILWDGTAPMCVQVQDNPRALSFAG